MKFNKSKDGDGITPMAEGQHARNWLCRKDMGRQETEHYSAV